MVTPLSCSLVGQEQMVRIVPGTRAAACYDAPEATERYYCNYGVNGAYRERLEERGLRVSGVGAEGEIRIVELADHPFFVATLFLPQARSAAGAPHALLTAYADAIGRRVRR